MELRWFGRAGIRVSELCLGAMTFGRECDEAQSHALLDCFIEAGGNFIDTANAYATGVSESFIGRYLAAHPGLRNRLVIATKFRRPMSQDPNDLGNSRRHIRIAVEDSLRRLGSDWIDLYQSHAWDERTPLEETLSTLDALVREGKVRYVGVSNFAGWHIAKALGLAQLHHWEPFVSVQPEYSLLERGAEREILPLCASEGLAAIPWSPLAGGLLTGKYVDGAPPATGTRGADSTPQAAIVHHHARNPRLVSTLEAVRAVAAETGRGAAQVALNWVLHRPAVTAPIVGARTVAQLRDNIGATGWRLAPEQMQRLTQASDFEVGYPYRSISLSNPR
ncbi:MAG: aldo/keto reductase [Gammaproteobacteria bacterium]